jgi:hypothetical protein
VDKLFVGIDVGSRDNAAYIMLPDGSKHSSFRVQNDLGGAQTTSKRVVSALEETGFVAVVIGIEATSIYGDSLIYFLREDGALAGTEEAEGLIGLVYMKMKDIQQLFVSSRQRPKLIEVKGIIEKIQSIYAKAFSDNGIKVEYVKLGSPVKSK